QEVLKGLPDLPHHGEPEPMRKRKPLTALEEEMMKRGAVAQMRRTEPGVGDPDPDRRIEIHDVETQLGRFHVAVSRDALRIGNTNVMLDNIDHDLRGAVLASAAAFN